MNTKVEPSRKNEPTVTRQMYEARWPKKPNPDLNKVS
jgi:hypothetical protein